MSDWAAIIVALIGLAGSGYAIYQNRRATLASLLADAHKLVFQDRVEELKQHMQEQRAEFERRLDEQREDHENEIRRLRATYDRKIRLLRQQLDGRVSRLEENGGQESP